MSSSSVDPLAPQIEWLTRLVGYDTTSALSNLTLIDDVEAYLKSHGVEAWQVPNEEGTKANLYAVVGPMVAGGVVLSGHTDVVPVAGQDWHTDPFTVVEKDALFYGRGTCDMKAFSAIGLSLVPDMIAADLKHPIIFALSYDEEIGCLGAPDMIDRIVAEVPTPAAVIVGEPTSMKVVDGHKGIASYHVEVTGFTTHSSQTDRGVSAVMMAARLIVWIEEEAKRLAAQPPAKGGFYPPYSTMTVNVVSGGTQLNIMAAQCSFDFDLRTVPGDDPADIIARLAAFAAEIEAEMKAKDAGCGITITQMTNAPCLAPKDHNPAADLCKAITGQNHTEVVAYCAEAGQFQQAGLSTVICGPGSIDQAHQANEFISREQLAAGTDFMRLLIKRLSV